MQPLAGNDAEPGFLQEGRDLAGEIAPGRIRLDDRKGAFPKPWRRCSLDGLLRCSISGRGALSRGAYSLGVISAQPSKAIALWRLLWHLVVPSDAGRGHPAAWLRSHRLAGPQRPSRSAPFVLFPQTPGAAIRPLGFARIGSRGLNGPVALLLLCCSLRRRARPSGRLASLASARGASTAQSLQSASGDVVRPSLMRLPYQPWSFQAGAARAITPPDQTSGRHAHHLQPDLPYCRRAPSRGGRRHALQGRTGRPGGAQRQRQDHPSEADHPRPRGRRGQHHPGARHPGRQGGPGSARRA